MKPEDFRLTKIALLSGAALVSLCAAPAFAQDQSGEDEALIADTIVVTGTRLQNQRAIDARRNSDTVVDAVTSDDIGRLPDFNVGEALQRLPGIGIQNDQAEARFVTIRALNAEYNYTTIDGVSVAVPDRNGRRVFMDVMPASLAQRIDVIKTFTPNLEGSAIGGIIDIRTADAFSMDAGTFNVNAEIGQYELDEGYRDVGPSGTADVFYSTKFGDSDQFGLVVTGNYYKRDSVVPQTEWGSQRFFYNTDGTPAGQPDDPPYSGNGYPVPAERRGYWYHNERERFGGTAKFQFRPNDAQEYFIRGFWNTATDDEARQTDLLTGSANAPIQNQTETSGTVLSATRQAHYLGQFDFERTVWQVAGGGDLDFGDDGELTFRANYSGSYFNNPENWAEWRMSGDNDGDGVDDNAFSYEQRGDTIFISLVDPAANREFTQFGANRRQFDQRELNEDLYEFKLDWTDSFGASGNWSYGTGLSFRRVERDFDENRDRYQPTATNDYTMAAANVVNDSVCLQPPGFTGDQCIVVIEPGRATANWAQHFADNPDQWTLNALTNDDERLDYSLSEDVMAIYGLLKYETDRTNLTFGVRFEDTSVDGTGRQNVTGTGWTDVSSEGGYSDFLPSVNYSYELSEDFLFRAAASRTIGRPGYNLIAPVGESFNPDTLTISRSNPDLEPRRSNNFDIGLDWYFDDGQGLLGGNIFYKRVEGEIFRGATTVTIDVDGVPTEVDAVQPLNAGEDTNIWGLELQLVKNLDFITEGLGIAANATFLDTDFTVLMNDGTLEELVTMIGQPEEAYNASIFYDRGPFSAKLAYNYQGLRASQRINLGREYRNRYDTDETSLDFKATYRVNDRFAVNFNAWNLSGEGRGEVLGFDQEIPIVEAEFGSAYFIGFSYKH